MERKPNVIFIMTDEQNVRGLSCYSRGPVPTPTADRMADEGVRFDTAIATNPVCMPSRASFMTGRYSHAHGVRINGLSLPATEVSLPELFKQAGYTTALCGKNHCFHSRTLSTVFDHRFTAMHFGITDEIPDDFPKGAKEANRYYRDHRDEMDTTLGHGVFPYPAELSDAGLITESAVRFIEANGEQPFFMWLSYPGPHWPFTCPEGYQDIVPPDRVDLPPAAELAGKPEYLRAVRKRLRMHEVGEEDLRKVISLYYGNCRNIDDRVGRVLDTLDRCGLEEDTIVIFTSDHGDFLGEHGLMHKARALYDCLTRIPFIWRWPGHVEGGHVSDALVENVDLLPTLVDLCGLVMPPGVQGRSLADGLLRRGPFPQRDACFAEVGDLGAPLTLETLEAKGIPEFDPVHGRTGMGWASEPMGLWDGRAKMVRTREWKLCYYAEGTHELYNLKDDPGELHNLYGMPEHAPIVQELMNRLLAWEIDSEDPLPPAGAARKSENYRALINDPAQLRKFEVLGGGRLP